MSLIRTPVFSGPELVDHLHEHRNLWYSLTNPSNVAHPDVDIRETSSEYAIDVELPGVNDKDSIMLRWISSRHLVLEGNIHRSALSTGQGEGSEALLVGERKMGPYRRHFSFPVEVDPEGLKANLEAGLLMIRAPKRTPHDIAAGRIDIK